VRAGGRRRSAADLAARRVQLREITPARSGTKLELHAGGPSVSEASVGGVRGRSRARRS